MSDVLNDFGVSGIAAMLEPPKHPVSPCQRMMNLCKVSGFEESRSIQTVMLHKDSGDVREFLDTFESELKQGMHKRANKLISVAMSRLKALPDVR